MAMKTKKKVPAPPIVTVVDPSEPPESRLARIQIYEQRAAARLPLFEDGSPAPPEPPRGRRFPICFGCATIAPVVNHLYAYGWHSIPIRNHEPEIYCPACFAEIK